MKRYSVFQAIFLSFFSSSLYRDVARRWRGIGFGYLLLVLALVWIPTIIKMQMSLVPFVNREGMDFARQVPKITISNGEVSTDVATPYFIKDQDGEDFMIIDTSGEYESLDSSSAKVLLTKSKLIMKRNETETRTYDLAGVQDFSVDRATVEHWLSLLKTGFIPVFYPLALIGSFIFRAVQVLIYALFGLLFAALLGARLNYPSLMRLAAVSLTPILIINVLLEFIPFSIPFQWLLGFLITMGYLLFAVKCNTTPDNEMAEPPAPSAPAMAA
jgi:hypothetical protein